MKILFISSIITEKDFDSISDLSKKFKPSIAGQRFERMIAKGLITNESDLEILSYPPLGSYPNTKKIFWGHKKEVLQGAVINYIPLINLPIFKQVSIILFTFLYLLYWNLINFKSKRSILLNLVYIPTAIPTLLITKIFKIKNTVLVPDVSSFRFSYGSTTNKLKVFLSSILKYTSEFFDQKFDSYLLLTEHMNTLVNKKSKPYLVIEGMIEHDVAIETINMNNVEANKNKYIMYAGTLRAKYGITNLIQAFLQIEEKDLELWIFGSGDQEEYIKNLSKENKRIKYKGLRPFKEVFYYEKSAELLVNPRPSDEEFTKYSFPSKTLEYMSSGTPLLTTNLPGIPKEYESYLYFFEDESINGIKDKVNEILNINDKELKSFGIRSKNFAVESKNYKVQTKKIYDFISTI